MIDLNLSTDLSAAYAAIAEITDAPEPLHNLASVLIEKNQAFDIETDETSPGRIVIRAKPNEFLRAILKEIRMTEQASGVASGLPES